MAKQTLATRQMKAEERKQKIMSTGAFHEWWQARQNIHPIPSDPFRAFMIDIALRAQVHTKEIWRGRTHRADYPTIDLPSGVPAPKRRLPSRKEERRFKRVPSWAQPYGEKTEFEKQIQMELDKMAEKLHVATPRLALERGEGAMGSAYWAGQFGGISPFIKIGVKGGRAAEPQILAALEHEFGHHAHAKRGLAFGASGLSTGFAQASRIEREREAWRIVDPFMLKGRPVQKFTKKYALGTYLGTTRPETVIRMYGVRQKKRK